MKIIKFGEFFLENQQDTPESYGDSLLMVMKKKIDKMFNYEMGSSDELDNNPKTIQDAKKSSKGPKKESFKDFGLRLESSEISKYSRTNDSLTVKFSDDTNTYTLIIMVSTKDIVNDMTEKGEDEDFSIKDIKKCYVKFKKYDLDTFEVLGQLSKNVDVEKIDEDFIIELKVEIDDTFDDDEEEFKIETE